MQFRTADGPCRSILALLERLGFFAGTDLGRLVVGADWRNSGGHYQASTSLGSAEGLLMSRSCAGQPCPKRAFWSQSRPALQLSELRAITEKPDFLQNR